MLLGRSSARLRNPANAAPDWVQAWLDDPDRSLEGIAVVEGGQARVLRALVTQPPCTTCHGPVEQIPDEVRQILAVRYPGDAATGFQAGALRGAIWASAAAPGE